KAPRPPRIQTNFVFLAVLASWWFIFRKLPLTRFFPRQPGGRAHSTRGRHHRPTHSTPPRTGTPTGSPGQSRRIPMHLKSRTPDHFQPTVTALESRALPSAAVAVIGSKLDITCDDAGSAVQVRDNGKGDVTVVVKSATGTVTAAGTGITDVAVHGKAGNDSD